MQHGPSLIFTYLKTLFMQHFWFTVSVTVLITYHAVYEPTSNHTTYVPKSQRSKMKQALRRCFSMLLKSWLKGWKRLDQRINKIKTKPRHKYYRHFNYLKRKRPKQCLKPRFFILHAPVVDCYSNDESHQPRSIHFDTDSRKLRVDNGASRCMSSYIEDFIDVPQPTNESVRGVVGSANNNKKGTIQWSIEDDDGKTHVIRLPNSLYVPETNIRLLSPQHWSQTAKDHKPNNRGTWSGTYHDCVELWWEQCKYKRTVPLDPGETNVGTITTAPGYTRYHDFCCRD